MSYKILIAEDEEMLRDVLVEALHMFGMECVAVENGKLALEYLQKNTVDFVVTDIKMPEMDGITLVREVRKLDPKQPPILIVTGFSDLANDEDAKAIGAIGLVNKPYNINVINQIIQDNLSPA